MSGSSHAATLTTMGDGNYLRVPSPRGVDTRLWLADPGLNNCVLRIVSRNTHGVVLVDTDRFNHFPATPSCSLAWYLDGHGELVLPADSAAAAAAGTNLALPGRMLFVGPQTRPLVTYNAVPIHGLMLVMLPDAVRSLTGLDPLAYVDRAVPIQAAFGPEWVRWSESLSQTTDLNEFLPQIENFLLPRWRAVDTGEQSQVRRMQDWTKSLASRAAAAGTGRSQRQAERRIKSWTGQTLRELRGFSRAEMAFYKAVSAIESGDLNWTDLATDAGFSDQSHMCRAFRRITGFSPEEFLRRLDSDESLWVYRAWRHK